MQVCVCVACVYMLSVCVCVYMLKWQLQRLESKFGAAQTERVKRGGGRGLDRVPLLGGSVQNLAIVIGVQCTHEELRRVRQVRVI